MIWIAGLVSALLALPLTVLGLQCLLALVRTRSNRVGDRRRLAVLIPAHNEQGVIAATIRLVHQQLADGDRVVVVADNCSDATAEIARGVGAEVTERSNDRLRGKGYALEAGVEYLKNSDPPEVVVILDADCELQPGALDLLAQTCGQTGRPVQARYLMRLPKQPGPEASVSTFAFLVKNWVRPRALQRLGLPVLLTGTGMAFPWKLIVDAPLGSSEIVEDLTLGLHFTRQGLGPIFCEDAHVWSDLPSDPSVAIQQRTRWEHGYLGAILRDVPLLIRDAVLRGKPQLLLTALDLMVPPLALLAILSLAVAGGLLFFGLMSGHWGPLLLLLSAGAFAGLGVCVAWLRFGRELVPWNVVVQIPRYVFAKLGVYGRFVGKRQTEWVRTRREGEEESSQ
jgi:cellulose synthase/poly-beta-1,6-N-acetylglucosamine synthase-like glycosyltransferase